MSEENKIKREFDIFIANSTYPSVESIFAPEFQTLEEVKNDCIVVLDTNVLLLPYQIGEASLKEIQKKFELLISEKRLIIPGQVAREFVKNRPFNLGELYQQLSRRRNCIQLPKLGDHYPLLESFQDYQEMVGIENKLHEVASEYRKAVKRVLSHIEGWNWNDPVSNLYSQLFTGSIIKDLPIDDTTKEEIKRELDLRHLHKLPPGYKDSGKSDNGVGDLLIWYTIIEVGKKYKKSVIFVSGEEKSDWWYRSESKALYPRYELVDEFRRSSEGQSFHIIELSRLLELYNADRGAIKEVQQKENKVNENVFLSISYEEFKPETYQGVKIIAGTDMKTVFSGNVIEDFKKALKIASEISDPGNIILSSSVDNFSSDSGVNLLKLLEFPFC